MMQPIIHKRGTTKKFFSFFPNKEIDLHGSQMTIKSINDLI